MSMYFRQITHDRLLNEMIGSTKESSQTTRKVLIMDSFTVKVMSYALKMTEIIDAGVSVVEDIGRRRQPLQTMDAIYFIQPTKENVVKFMFDMGGKKSLYNKAFVFFSSAIASELVGHIKKNARVSPRIGALNEMNLEYIAFDTQGFITHNERALEDLFGDVENHRKADACLDVMAARIATVFASMKEFPFVRYRAAKSIDANTMTTYRDLIPTKLAARIWNYLNKYKTTAAATTTKSKSKTSIVKFPQSETCELLVIDRSVDEIAPVIHEWTYDAMCRDLLNLEGNKYDYEVSKKTGGPLERKEVLLEEHDPIWLELRHLHIAEASERLHGKVTNFVKKNNAARFLYSSRQIGELSTRELRKMTLALPQYRDQSDKLSLHVEIAGKINRIIREQGLKEIGQLEQDLVFGDAGTKEVINFLKEHEDLSQDNKLRLLMVYAAIYPEKFESDNGEELMQVARLSSDDMKVVSNMKLLGRPPETKKSYLGAYSSKFDNNKKHRFRKERAGEETSRQLSRFYPVVEELVQKLSKGELPKNEYPCMNDPTPMYHGTSHPAAMQYTETPVAYSMWSRRTLASHRAAMQHTETPVANSMRSRTTWASHPAAMQHTESPIANSMRSRRTWASHLAARQHTETPVANSMRSRTTPTWDSYPAARQYNETSVAKSMRSRTTPTWASRPLNSDDSYSSNLIHRQASSDFKKMGKRIFVFIVGGATRSELRACHKLTTKLNREVILGSSTIDDPSQFIKKLKVLSTSELSLDDIVI